MIISPIIDHWPQTTRTRMCRVRTTRRCERPYKNDGAKLDNAIIVYVYTWSYILSQSLSTAIWLGRSGYVLNYSLAHACPRTYCTIYIKVRRLIACMTGCRYIHSCMGVAWAEDEAMYSLLLFSLTFKKVLYFFIAAC